MRNKLFYITCLILTIVSVVGLTGCGKQVVNSVGAGTSHFNSSIQTDNDLTVNDDATIGDDLSVLGEFTAIEGITSVASVGFSTTTLTAAMSGNTFYVSASGTDFKLPAVTNAGANYRFVVGAAVDGTNIQVVSSERDNIDGTLIVAGAVVDCRGEDQINFVVDGEQLGDYVEVRSNGTQWYIGDSGVLTAAKMTCTDPF